MANLNPLNIDYKHNDCDVVVNPFVLWSYKPPKSLAWLYWEIKIGKCKNGLWDFGYWNTSGCSPCSLGQFESYEIAEQKAISFFKKVFAKGNDKSMCNDQFFKLGKADFSNFLNGHYLKDKEIVLQDFQTDSNNYVQGSLF